MKHLHETGSFDLFALLCFVNVSDRFCFVAFCFDFREEKSEISATSFLKRRRIFCLSASGFKSRTFKSHV